MYTCRITRHTESNFISNDYSNPVLLCPVLVFLAPQKQVSLCAGINDIPRSGFRAYRLPLCTLLAKLKIYIRSPVVWSTWLPISPVVEKYNDPPLFLLLLDDYCSMLRQMFQSFDKSTPGSWNDAVNDSKLLCYSCHSSSFFLLPNYSTSCKVIQLISDGLPLRNQII